jgi:hypothetical protein
MKKNANIIICIIMLIFFLPRATDIFSKELIQVVKGKVYNSESHTQLPCANVVILGINPAIGTTTDTDGNFKITNVPIGRYNIQVSFMSYETVITMLSDACRQVDA